MLNCNSVPVAKAPNNALLDHLSQDASKAILIPSIVSALSAKTYVAHPLAEERPPLTESDIVTEVSGRHLVLRNGWYLVNPRNSASRTSASLLQPTLKDLHKRSQHHSHAQPPKTLTFPLPLTRKSNVSPDNMRTKMMAYWLSHAPLQRLLPYLFL